MRSGSTMPRAVVKKATDYKAGVSSEATLLLETTSNYTLMYNDNDSGADMDVGLYRPLPPAGFYIIGDYAQNNYSDPNGTTMVVQAVHDDPNIPLLIAPDGYKLIWNDNGSGADMDGSVWYPIPPGGYVSLGYVSQSGYDVPDISTYRCVREDMVQIQDEAGPLIWSDKGSGADMDISIFSQYNPSGSFIAINSYGPWSGPIYFLKQS